MPLALAPAPPAADGRRDPLLALQWALRRRAGHVGRLLMLRASAERGPPGTAASPALAAFLRANESAVFCGQEEGDKEARRTMLRIEEGRRSRRRKEGKKEEEENLF